MTASCLLAMMPVLILACMLPGHAWATMLFLPQDIVGLEPYHDAMVLISGDLGRAAAGAIITISITAPDGTPSSFHVTATSSGEFQLFHRIPAGMTEEIRRDSEGIYRVSGSYRVLDPDGNLTGFGSLGSGKFAAYHNQKPHDHTVWILSDGTEGCSDLGGRCYASGNPSIHAAESVEWYNRSGTAHLIGSAADSGFEVGLVPPKHSKSYRFDAPGTYAYSCMYHPWMTGVVRVSEAGNARSAEMRAEPSSGSKGIVMQADPEWHNAGDRLSQRLELSGLGGTAHVTMTDHNGTVVGEWNVTAGRDGTGRLGGLSQPAWSPGKYTISASTGNDILTGEIRIVQHPIRCMTHDIMPVHGTPGCFAGLIYNVLGHDSISVDGNTITLTAINADPAGSSMDMIRDLCPRGSIAVVDPDDLLVSDTRGYAAEDGWHGYAAVYCGGDPTSINERLLDSGLARLDRIGCASTEFEWGMCVASNAGSEAALGNDAAGNGMAADAVADAANDGMAGNDMLGSMADWLSGMAAGMADWLSGITAGMAGTLDAVPHAGVSWIDGMIAKMTGWSAAGMAVGPIPAVIMSAAPSLAAGTLGQPGQAGNADHTIHAALLAALLLPAAVLAVLLAWQRCRLRCVDAIRNIADLIPIIQSLLRPEAPDHETECWSSGPARHAKREWFGLGKWRGTGSVKL